jgi:peptidyl-dipeptidase Dcp
MQNPLLANFASPFDTAPFDTISTSDYLPAIQQAIQLAKADIERIKANSNPTFSNTIEALDQSGKLLGRISAIFFNLNSAETNDEIQKLAREISPLLT